MSSVRQLVIRWLDKQSVESSEGFALQGTQHNYYYYREGNRTMQVVVTQCWSVTRGYYEQVSLPSLNRWLPPDDELPLSEGERARVETNVDFALGFMGIDHEFTWI